MRLIASSVCAGGAALHPRKWICPLNQPEQAEQVRQRVFQRAVENRDSSGDLLATGARVVLRQDLEVDVQEIDHRQVGRRLAMRHRQRLQHHPAALIADLEFVIKARLAHPRFGHRGYDLAPSRLRQFCGTFD